MNTHTPGPWSIEPEFSALPNVVSIYGPIGANVGNPDFRRCVARSVSPEDASLIAAAPELLYLVRDFLWFFASRDILSSKDLVEEAQVVYKKAGGL